MADPFRGDVWTVDLDPTRGHEQVGRRPALVISVDLFNQGPADLVVVLPITTKAKGVPLHVEIAPPEGGVRATSYIKCEDIRSAAKQRLGKFLGRVSPDTLHEVEDRLAVLLGMPTIR